MSTISYNLTCLLWAPRNFERFRTWALEDRRTGDLTDARMNAAKARKAWAEIKVRRALIESALPA